MSGKLNIQGEYPVDWPEIGDRVRAENGHRCIRCGHPYKAGEYGKGEWSPCEELCTHAGPIIGIDPDLLSAPEKINELADIMAELPGDPLNNTPSVKKMLSCRPPGNTKVIVARWRILTVHHMDGDKSNCSWWNLLALCQRCHLQIQTRVNPQIPYFLEHSEWAKPYVAGFYAKKYLNLSLTRDEVSSRQTELLALERLA